MASSWWDRVVSLFQPTKRVRAAQPAGDQRPAPEDVGLENAAVVNDIAHETCSASQTSSVGASLLQPTEERRPAREDVGLENAAVVDDIVQEACSASPTLSVGESLWQPTEERRPAREDVGLENAAVVDDIVQETCSMPQTLDVGEADKGHLQQQAPPPAEEPVSLDAEEAPSDSRALGTAEASASPDATSASESEREPTACQAGDEARAGDETLDDDAALDAGHAMSSSLPGAGRGGGDAEQRPLDLSKSQAQVPESHASRRGDTGVREPSEAEEADVPIKLSGPDASDTSRQASVHDDGAPQATVPSSQLALPDDATSEMAPRGPCMEASDTMEAPGPCPGEDLAEDGFAPGVNGTAGMSGRSTGADVAHEQVARLDERRDDAAGPAEQSRIGSFDALATLAAHCYDDGAGGSDPCVSDDAEPLGVGGCGAQASGKACFNQSGYPDDARRGDGDMNEVPRPEATAAPGRDAGAANVESDDAAGMSSNDAGADMPPVPQDAGSNDGQNDGSREVHSGNVEVEQDNDQQRADSYSDQHSSGSYSDDTEGYSDEDEAEHDSERDDAELFSERDDAEGDSEHDDAASINEHDDAEPFSERDDAESDSEHDDAESDSEQDADAFDQSPEPYTNDSDVESESESDDAHHLAAFDAGTDDNSAPEDDDDDDVDDGARSAPWSWAAASDSPAASDAHSSASSSSASVIVLDDSDEEPTRPAPAPATPATPAMPAPPTSAAPLPRRRLGSFRPDYSVVAQRAMTGAPATRAPTKRTAGAGISQRRALSSTSRRRRVPLAMDEFRAGLQARQHTRIVAMIRDTYLSLHGPSVSFHDFHALVRKRAHVQQLMDLETLRGEPRVAAEDEHTYTQRTLEALRARETRAAARLPPAAPTPERARELRREARRKRRAQHGILGRPALPNQLPAAAEARVEEAWRQTGVLASMPGAQVSAHDFAKLRPGKWLNDEVINFYGHLIMARAAAAREAQHVGAASAFWDVHFFTSFFWETLSQRGYAGVRRWSRKVDLFTKDVVLLPINVGQAHWVCAAIHLRLRRFEYYDSMGMASPQVFQRLRKYLADEMRDKQQRELYLDDWQDVFGHDQSPQQQNGYDCGVFAVQTLEQLSRREPLEPFPAPLSADDFTGPADPATLELWREEYGDEYAWNFAQSHMPYLRRRMAYEIVTQALLPS